MSVRILLVDRQEIFVQGLRALLESEPGFEVLPHAAEGQRAVRLALEERPDVILIGVSVPGVNGIEVTRQITSELPHTKVICLTARSEAKLVEAALDAGAAGYVMKNGPFEELVRAIRTVRDGQCFMSPGATTSLVEAFRNRPSKDEVSAFSLLTAREREVLQLLAEGHATGEIASRLSISAKTVATHREHVKQKLNIQSIAGLTKYAIKEGLTTAE
jgi:two-component system secretion response regulator SsrB